MPRGAEYDDGVPHSDNAIKAGQTKVHGAGNSVGFLPILHSIIYEYPN